MPKGKAFLYFCLSFVGGIFLSSFIQIPQEMLWGFFILGLILVISLFRDKRFVVLGVCMVLFVVGVYRHQQVIEKTSEISRYNDAGEVTLKGVVSREPDVRVKSTQLTIDIRQLTTDNRQQNTSGRILVTTQRYPEYEYGDELEIAGVLQSPTEDLEGFNYQSYLAKDGIYSVMFFPDVTYVRKNERGPTSFMYARIFEFKDRLRESIYRAIPPPQSEILGAILLGDKRKLSDDLKEKLNITGTRHITAISGMHIAIISAVLLQFFLWMGLWRHHAFYISIIVLALFILMVGAPPSAIRAGVMGGALLFTQNLGRPKSAPRAILYAALIMLFLNPLLLRFDVGFQLSFLAVMGIAVFSPWLLERLKFIPEILNMRGISAMTISAQFATLPILVVTFGRASLVSLFSNILIVPLLPFIMIGGFISGITGIFLEPLGRILSWPVWLVLKYITLVIDFFASVPLASVMIENIHWMWIVPYYLLLFWFYKKYVRNSVSNI